MDPQDQDHGAARLGDHSNNDKQMDLQSTESRDDGGHEGHMHKDESWIPDKRILEQVLDTLQRRDTYEIFAEPVDPSEVEEYYEIIKEPMDFGTMRAKLHEGMYKTLQQFEHDVFLIFDNAMHFNSSATVYFRQARALEELAKRVFHVLRTDPKNFELEFPTTRRRSTRGIHSAEFKALSFGACPKVDRDLQSNTTSTNIGRRGCKRERRAFMSDIHRRSTYKPWSWTLLDEKCSTVSPIHHGERPLIHGSFHSESTFTTDANESSKYGFWGILAQKGKSILDIDDPTDSPNRRKHQVNDTTGGSQLNQLPRQPSEGGSRIDNAKLRKRFDALTSSLNNLGDSIGNAFEEGRSLVENKTQDIIQETRKFQIRRRGGNSDAQDQATVVQNSSWQRPVIQPTVSNNQGTQLKASRDVAMATAAKAKVLLRELKAVKAELAFAKQRCAQLEEENKRLRESREKGENPADDDLIRLQLESLLAEKARLAHENALHARENRFLREIVEYHRLTMQDFVYLEEGAEEVSEDYPFSIEDTKALSSTPTSPMSPMFFQDVSSLYFPTQIKEHRTEVPKDEPNNTPCSPSSSFLSLKPSPLGFQPERTETSEGPTTLQRVEEEERETSSSTNPSNAGDGDEKRPSVS